VQSESISVFFPAYNDEHTIGTLVRQADALLARLGFADYEIIAVNDGSRDGTATVLEAAAREFPRLRVITHPQNRGYGGALRSGFQAASKSLVFYTDGDGQYDVNELELLLRALTDDVDVVNGFKLARQDNWLRDIVGKLYRSTLRVLFQLPIRDVDCDFRLIRRRALDRITLTMDSGAICLELIAQLTASGARFKEVGVHHYPRQYGRSQFFRPRHIIRTLLDDVRFWFQLRQARRQYAARAERQSP